MRILVWMVISLSLFASNPLVAQVIHQPPSISPASPRKDEVVLTIKAKSTNADLAAAKIQLANGQLLILKNDGDVLYQVAVVGRTIWDVVQELRAKHGANLEQVQSNYLFSSTRVLQDGTSDKTLGEGVSIKASRNNPEVRIGFGLVVSPKNGVVEETSGLLSQTGFQLDVVGDAHVFRRAEKTATTVGTDSTSTSATTSSESGWVKLIKFKWLPPILPKDMQMAGRLGLHGNQQLNVTTDDAANAVGNQVESALRQADQVALTLDVPLVWQNAKAPIAFALTPSYGVSWNQLRPFTFPTIQVGTTIQEAEDAFDSVAINNARLGLDRTFPLSEFGINGTFHFKRGETPIFYLGGGVAKVEQTDRTVSFDRDASGVPVPASLRGVIDTPAESVWRAMGGFQIPGIVDLRLDAAGPIGDRDRDAVVRIIISRAFPLTR